MRLAIVSDRRVAFALLVAAALGWAGVVRAATPSPSSSAVQQYVEWLRNRYAYTNDPFNGTWVLNVAKSKFNDPANASKKDMIKITVQGDGETNHVEGVMPDDRVEVQDYTVKYDGKDYPNKVVTTTNSMLSLRKVNPRTRERVNKRDGRIAGISRREVSADGKTLTTSLINVDASGKETVRQVRVFDKQ